MEGGSTYALVGQKVVTSRSTALRLLWGVGFGVSGQVYAAEDLNTGQHLAVKVCRIQAEPEKQQRAEREWKIALKLNHANVLALREVHIDDVYVYMIMDLCDGGELFDRVARSGGLGEDLARYYFKQIVAGLAYCHEQQVWHRDLKLENLLMVEKSTDSLVKIADFGLSKDAAELKPVDASCGTVSYMAPEICLLQPGQIYNEAKADIWSLGVILYVMRCCAYPFGHDGRGGERTDIVFARAMRRRWRNPGQLESKCSSSLQDLIKSMLSVEPEKRPSLAEVQHHPWFQAGKPYIPPPPNRSQGRQGPFASPQMSPQWQWPTSAPAPEPSTWEESKGAANSGSPFVDEEFSLGAGQFMHTPPRRSHSLVSRPDHDEGPREFSLTVGSNDVEFADVFAEGQISCELTATTTEELQTGLADMLGLPDALHIWYTDPSFGVPAVILDIAVLPPDATVQVRRPDDSNDPAPHSPKSPKQDPVIKRLRKELVDLTRNAPPGVSAMPVTDDMLRWKAVIRGEPETCWEGGLFHFAIEFPQGYPFKPFKLWLETKMYHPNVSVQGEGEGEGEGGERREFAQTFASAMLRRWSPAHTVRKVLTEIRRVILEPSLEDPLNDAVAQQFTHSREEYEEGVRDWVVRFAGPPAAGAEQLAAAAEQARDDE